MSQISHINQNSAWEVEPQGDLGYGQLFATLWNRRYWFAGVFGGVLAVSVPIALAKDPLYLSQMQVLPESNYQAKQIRTSGVESQFPESQFIDTSVEIDYATQLKVLKSSEILRRVVDKLGWQVSPEEEIILIESLRSALTVSQIADVDADKKTIQTKIIQTSYYDQNPAQAKKVLEAIRDVYLEYNLEQQEKRLNDGLSFIEKQIPKAREELNKAEASITRLTKKHNLVDPEQEAIALKANIRDIASERERIKAERNQLKGNYQTLQQKLGLSPETAVALSRLSQSARYQNLLNELQTIELDLATKRSSHQESSPVVQELAEQKKSKQSLLRSEAQAVLGTLPSNFEQLISLQQQSQLVTSDNQFISDITQAQADLEGLSGREVSLATTEQDLRARLTQFPELISRYRDLTQEAEVRREALQRLREAKQELEIELNRGGSNWQVIEPPQLGTPVGVNTKKDLMLSFVVASFLGVSAAFIREAIDSRLANLKEVERQTALPLLGSTPSLVSPNSNKFVVSLPFMEGSKSDSQTIADVVQWQPFREALDVVYENLRLSGLTSTLRSLAVTSATVGEGKSTLALGLALSVARHQQRVLVIDADLRHPGLRESFNLHNSSGLTEYLAGAVEQPDVEQISIQGEQIDLITSGRQTADPVKLLSSSRLQRLIEEYESEYDLILVDTPPAIGTVDAVKIASICDSALLTMRLNQVKSSELSEAEALLSKLNVLGIVANDSREHESKSTYLLPQSV